jgi:AcrR family transcriptional regulator
MPKVTPEHRTARKREITRAALRLFAKQGFQATSMADIIAESGLSAGAIYGHYTGKDELIHSAITEFVDIKDMAGAPLDDSIEPPGDMMRRFLGTLESTVGDLGLLVQVWAQAVLDPTAREATDGIGEQLRTIWSDYLVRWYRDGLGLDALSAEAAATKFAPLHVGIMQGCILQTVIFTNFDRETYFAAVTELQPAH